MSYHDALGSLGEEKTKPGLIERSMNVFAGIDVNREMVARQKRKMISFSAKPMGTRSIRRENNILTT